MTELCAARRVTDKDKMKLFLDLCSSLSQKFKWQSSREQTVQHNFNVSDFRPSPALLRGQHESLPRAYLTFDATRNDLHRFLQRPGQTRHDEI